MLLISTRIFLEVVKVQFPSFPLLVCEILPIKTLLNVNNLLLLLELKDLSSAYQALGFQI